MTACLATEPAPETDESTAAVLGAPTIPRGAVWQYWDRGGAPGQSWQYNYFDDSTWGSGAGPLGYGESYLGTTVGYGGNAANKYITTYFRYELEVDEPDVVSRMMVDLMYDDGVIVWINGSRVLTVGMPISPDPTPTTLAVGHEAGNTYTSFDISAFRSALREGTNVIAVEVHQSEASSSDLVFDLSLVLEMPSASPGVFIERGSTWQFHDNYNANAPYQWTLSYADTWDWDAGPGPLGYGESYVVTQIARPPTAYQAAPSTYYRYRFNVEDPTAVTELKGQLMYDDGVVVWLNGIRIDSLSMPATVTHQTLALDHEAQNQYVDRDWTAARSYLVQGVNLIAVELHQNSQASSDAVFDLALTYRTSPPPPVPTEDIARGAVWTYWDRGGDQGTAWRASSFDDSAWRRAPGPLGYGETYLATTVEYGPSSSNKYRTTYFRNRFRVADRNAVTSMIADVMYDDGAVIYLNGTEVKRLSMPAGTITASTFAASHETGNAYERHDLSAARNLLVDGDNVLTVEVHQSSASSSDLTFDLALDVTTGTAPPPPPSTPGIARGSSWRYFAGPTHPQGRWWDDRDSFNDDQWPLLPGPLGYGESYIRSTVPYGPDAAHKYMTTYFRSSFVIDDPTLVTTLVAEAMYDDGIVVYLNGNEVARRSMPTGYIEHDTAAIWHEANNTYETIDLAAALRYLKPGRNEVAVAVHQDVASSSDLVFDLAIHLERTAPRPTIPRRSNWLYYDRGAQPSGWQTSNDDHAWDGARAPIGYNIGLVNGWIGYDDAHDTTRRPITTYFRKHVTVASPAAVTELRGELLADDGAVIYINGQEVQRVAMPSGAVGFTTLAATHNSTSYEVFDWTAHTGLLHAGDNIIAVEVHQDSNAGDQGDLVFDLSLEVITAATPRIPGCSPVTPADSGSLSGVWIAPSGTVWAAGGEGMIGRRSPEGTWAWCWRDPNDQHSAVWGTADNDVWFAGAGGTLLRWNGSAFAETDLGTDAFLTDIWGSSGSDVFVVGENRVVRHFDGTTWHNADVPIGSVQAVWGASATDVWTVANWFEPAPDGDDYEDVDHAVIYRWDAVTQTFHQEADFRTQYGVSNFFGIGGSSATDVWAVGEGYPAGAAAGFAQAAHYDGTTWTEFTLWNNEEVTVDRAYVGVAAHAPGAENGAWIVSAGISAVRYDGTTFSVVDPDLTENLYDIDVRGQTMYAVGYPNKVLRWNGTVWVRDR